MSDIQRTLTAQKMSSIHADGGENLASGAYDREFNNMISGAYNKMEGNSAQTQSLTTAEYPKASGTDSADKVAASDKSVANSDEKRKAIEKAIAAKEKAREAQREADKAAGEAKQAKEAAEKAPDDQKAAAKQVAEEKQKVADAAAEKAKEAKEASDKAWQAANDITVNVDFDDNIFLDKTAHGFEKGAEELMEKLKEAQTAMEADPSNPSMLAAYQAKLQAYTLFRNAQTSTVKVYKDIGSSIVQNFR